ncbi:TetR/AcrR family transcriptional regulator [Bacillus sp. B15-48]|uniref:TetR/AcrR family transcriptional regulator n=1 Tax=Bacillus sp. B15-48 TaxID=1548601 RepID=UPI00193F2AE4|nr:TetR/AcrR family transcriptional regulator [Bacillus sp. B15-48]
MSKRLPADKRKRVIIRSAIQVFAETNYRVAKVSEIAKLSGVTEPIVYKHFDSKEDLFAEVLRKMGEKTLILFNSYRNEASGSTKEVLTYIIKTYLKSLNKYEKELQIFYQAISEIHIAKIKAVLLDCYESYANFIYDVIHDKEDGEERDIEYHDVSWEVIGFLIHLSTLYILQFYNEERAFEMCEKFVDKLDIKQG